MTLRKPAPPSRASHPLLHAGRELLTDLLSTLAFLLVYSVTGRLAVAIGWSIAVAILQIARAAYRGRSVPPLQWLGLGLVLVFGGGSVLTSAFILYRLKFTLIYLATALVMLTPGWLNRYVPAAALAYAHDVTTVFGYIWSGLFFLTAALNLSFAVLFRPSVWAWFIAVFPLASKLVLVGLQYAVTRRVVRRRRGAAAPPA